MKFERQDLEPELVHLKEYLEGLIDVASQQWAGKEEKIADPKYGLFGPSVVEDMAKIIRQITVNMVAVQNAVIKDKQTVGYFDKITIIWSNAADLLNELRRECNHHRKFGGPIPDRTQAIQLEIQTFIAHIKTQLETTKDLLGGWKIAQAQLS